MRKVGVLPVTIECEVAFHDVDMAQIVWHGHYIKYIENARWALMNGLGYGLDRMIAAGEGWPVVDLAVRYVRMSRFGDRLHVTASLIEWEYRIVLNYLIADAATGDRVARAQTTQVVVDQRSGALQWGVPPAFIDCVRSALDATGRTE